MKFRPDLIFAAGFCLLSAACGGEGGSARYGEKVRYRQGQAMTFPDFTLIYKGQRRVVPPQYPRGWWAYDFEIKAGGKTQPITWSAGTGLIDATDFSVGGKSFALERVMAAGVGKLKDDELVIRISSAR